MEHERADGSDGALAAKNTVRLTAPVVEVMTTPWFAFTPKVVTVKFALDWPAGTTTEGHALRFPTH